MSTISASTTTTTAYVVTADTTGALVLQTGATPTTALTIDTSQNVGINTTSPTDKLTVSASVRFGATSSNRILYLGQSSPADNGAGSLEFQVSNTAKNWAIRTNYNVAGSLEFCPSTAAGGTTYTTSSMLINSSGNVGIGTSSPTATGGYDKALDIVGGSNGAGLYVRGSTNPSTVYGAIQYDNYSNRTNINAVGASNYLRFVTVDTERMVIDASGNVNIGSSTAPNTGSLSNRFLQLVAYGYNYVGAATSNGILSFTCNIAANTATTFLTVAGIDAWSGTILISYVRDADQNRSGMKMVRYTYNRTYNILLDASQNSGATFSVSGSNLQVTIGGAGNYYTQFTIWGGAGA